MYLRRKLTLSQIVKGLESSEGTAEHAKANERCNVGVAAPIHFRGYCPHPSNHLRRRIHQPSLLPHNILRNTYAAQSQFSCMGDSAKSFAFIGKFTDLIRARVQLFHPR